jgi:hypothetical protein
MTSKRSRNRKSPNVKAAYFEAMDKMFQQAKTYFGSAVKSFWFHEGEICPACLKNSIGIVKFNGEEALALNAFMYRERGVLIGYFLCDTCTNYIHTQSKNNPNKQTALHTDIERNLEQAYKRHLATFN